MTTKYRILLFDVDGTLIKAGGAGREALNKACEELYGIERACDGLDFRGKTDLMGFREAYLKCRGTGDKTAQSPPTRAEMDRLCRCYLKHLPREVKRAFKEGRYRVSPGIERLLKRLSRENGFLLGLGTGNMERGAWIKLGPSELGRYFKFGGFGSDAYQRPALLRRAVRRARDLIEPDHGSQISPRNVFVIGDTPRDVQAGRKAGYRTIAVACGFSSWKELEASRPDHLARDFRNFDEWLSWLGIQRGKAGGGDLNG